MNNNFLFCTELDLTNFIKLNEQIYITNFDKWVFLSNLNTTLDSDNKYKIEKHLYLSKLNV